MGKTIACCAICFIASTAPAIYAQSWAPVGSPGFSAGETSYTSIAITSGAINGGRTTTAREGAIYVAYEDFGNGARASVMVFTDSGWVHVGNPGFSADTVGFTQIAVAPDGTPYVVYEDAAYSGGAATVMKFNGSSWVNVGAPGFSAGQVNWAGIAIDTAGTPYVVYSDFAYGGAAVVEKFNGSAWVSVGAPAFSAGEALYESIAIAEDGTPYVSLADGGYNTYTRVMKFDGGSWVNVGAPAFSAGSVGWTSIAIDPAGTPYVAYSDASLNFNAVVMKFNGSSWASVGAPGFSESAYVQYTSLALDGSGVPYVVYEDSIGHATAKTFNGSNWVTICNADFSAGAVGYTAIAMSSDGIPYVAYGDGINGGKATVMRPGTGDAVKKIGASAATSLSIFPNPNQGVFTLKLSSPSKEDAIIVITNMLGEKVKEITTTTNTDIQVLLESSPGLYFITAVTRNGDRIATKVVVE